MLEQDPNPTQWNQNPTTPEEQARLIENQKAAMRARDNESAQRQAQISADNARQHADREIQEANAEQQRLFAKDLRNMPGSDATYIEPKRSWLGRIISILTRR
jgi:hypothetical protein